MYLFFPGNYMWSLAVNRCLASGGHFGEIHWACQDLLEAASKPPSGDLEAWHRAWLKLAEQVETVARTAESGGHRVTAASHFYRATQYYQWTGAFLDPEDPRAAGMFPRRLECFAGFARNNDDAVELAEVPFDGSSLFAYFVAAKAPAAKRPAVILWDGLDGTKEEMFPMAAHLAARGISCLAIDIVGQGASLHLNGLKARADTEVCAAAASDWLAARPEVDAGRIGLIGASLGGYSAPRAAAYEKRIKACVAWGAIYDYRAIWVRRLESIGKGTRINPSQALGTTGKNFLNVFGAGSYDDALRMLEPYHLRDVAPKIECDFLLVHGADDRQTDLQSAQELFAAIGSRHKEMRIYTSEEGGAAHVQLDRQEPAASLIADWLADRLAPETRK
jgi:alpha-beta hydrolase superfamily lysophospholipase